VLPCIPARCGGARRAPARRRAASFIGAIARASHSPACGSWGIVLTRQQHLAALAGRSARLGQRQRVQPAAPSTAFNTAGARDLTKDIALCEQRNQATSVLVDHNRLNLHYRLLDKSGRPDMLQSSSPVVFVTTRS
jgi:hypothetical protein